VNVQGKTKHKKKTITTCTRVVLDTSQGRYYLRFVVAIAEQYTRQAFRWSANQNCCFAEVLLLNVFTASGVLRVKIMCDVVLAFHTHTHTLGQSVKEEWITNTEDMHTSGNRMRGELIRAASPVAATREYRRNAQNRTTFDILHKRDWVRRQRPLA